MKWNSLYQITAASRLGGYRPQIPVLSVLCPQPLSSTEFVEPPPEKIPGYTTASTIVLMDSAKALLDLTILFHCSAFMLANSFYHVLCNNGIIKCTY